MRVMVFGKATEDSDKGAPPSPEAFAAMDRFIEELIKAGVFVAGAGLKNSAQAKRIICEIEIRPFYEAADLAELMTPEELSAPREGERGKLGVA